MKASFRAFVDQFLESRFLNTGPFASSLIFRGIAVFYIFTDIRGLDQ